MNKECKHEWEVKEFDTGYQRNICKKCGQLVKPTDFKINECNHDWVEVDWTLGGVTDIRKYCFKCGENDFKLSEPKRDFKISENLSQINIQQWEDIWDEWNNSIDAENKDWKFSQDCYNFL